MGIVVAMSEWDGKAVRWDFSLKGIAISSIREINDLSSTPRRFTNQLTI